MGGVYTNHWGRIDLESLLLPPVSTAHFHLSLKRLYMGINEFEKYGGKCVCVCVNNRVFC